VAESDEGGTVTVRYFAAARAAAGTETETLTMASGSTIGALIDLLGDTRPPLATVLTRCSFLLDEVAVRDRTRVVPYGCRVDVLPPFAGG